MRSDLGGLNLSDVPKVLIETGNMRNATDAARLESAAYRQREARGARARARGVPRLSPSFPASRIGARADDAHAASGGDWRACSPSTRDGSSPGSCSCVVTGTLVLSARSANTPVPGYVGAPGSVQAEAPTAAELDNVRAQITTWLARNGFDGYRVSEVTAFTNNDYVVVQTKAGRDAFELLAAPGAGWLMLEPPSMLWNTRYGMPKSWETNWSGSGMMPSLMGGSRAAGQWNGWFAAGKAHVEARRPPRRGSRTAGSRARIPASARAACAASPATSRSTRRSRGKEAGMLSVNAATGAVWYHGWHGGFLAGRDYS